LQSPCPILALGVAVDLVAGAAKATEGGASLFIPGDDGPGAGIVPPPGFYFAKDFFANAGEISGARRIQISGVVLADMQTEIRADLPTAPWITPLEILGGRVGSGVLGFPKPCYHRPM
jgi:hypothetical protein